jgi:hypothetical protein
MNFLSLLPLLFKYGPQVAALIRVLLPVLKQAAPLFQQLAKEFPKDIAAQMAVATAAPHIETPRIDPLSGRKLRPGALTIQEEMGTAARMGG